MPTTAQDTDEVRFTRLSVNIALDVADALRDLAHSQGTTITDIVRRGIAVYKFLDDAMREGATVHLIGPGDRDRELTFPFGPPREKL